MYYLGVDGGGTKTKVVLVDQSGKVLVEKVGDSTNWNSVGDEKAHLALSGLLCATLDGAHATPSNVQTICLCMAGVDRATDREKLERWVRELLPNPALRVLIENDAIAALASGTSGILNGVVLISGTGTIASAVHNGKRHRAQGWGALIGDEGGGDSLGLAALRAVARAEDSGVHTALTALLLKELNLASAWDLIGWCYDGKFTFAKYAALSKCVFEAAKSGDAAALAIIHEKAQGLVDAARVVHGHVGLPERFTLVLAGGNLTHDDGNGIYAMTVKEKLRLAYPHATLALPSVEPAVAAALLAKNA